MPRANAMVPPEAIRIEDEVWQEAFARREPARAKQRGQLRAIDGDRQLRPFDGELDGDGELELRPFDGQLELRPFDAELELRPFDGELDLHAPEGAKLASAPQAASAPPRPRPVTAAGGASVSPTPVRRTVKIQGRGAERNLPWPDPNRRPPRRPYERHGFRPDRVAMWAVLLGLMLVLVAVLSAHG
jgi:hypothetical protein